MTKTILFIIIPFSLMLLIAVGMPFYRLNLMKKAGEKLLSLAKKSTKLSFFSAGIAILLMLLSVQVDFGRFNFVIPYCAVLGLFLTIRESTLYPVNGVYENLMIVGSEILRYQDIEKILTAEESTHPDYMIMIKQKNRDKSRQFIFDNANEAQEVLEVLKQRIDKDI